MFAPNPARMIGYIFTLQRIGKMSEMAEQDLDDAMTYADFGDEEWPEPTVKEEAVETIKCQPYFHGIDSLRALIWL